MLFWENIMLALSAIKANKLRSFLTMLGIIIGISSVIAITSIGASARAIINQEFEGIEAGYMAFTQDWRSQEPFSFEYRFSWEDIEALKSRFPDDIRYAEPMGLSTSSVVNVGRMEATLSLMGVGADYNKYMRSIQIIHGRMINQSDVDAARENIVIPIEAARHLFNRENVVGEILVADIRGRERDLTIVGVYETPPSIFSAFVMAASYECYVATSLLMGPDQRARYIEVFANPDKDPVMQAQAFLGYINRIKGQEEGFYMYQTADTQIQQINTIMTTLSMALGAIAAISLLVGGIGIMNIMLVSVTERTREIGIRKALGARTKDILTQFLIEAMILSCIGGIIGTALGLTTAGGGMALVGVGVVIQPAVVIFTVVFSAGVGLFFGIFPARKAAKLDPIESLRYE